MKNAVVRGYADKFHRFDEVVSAADYDRLEEKCATLAECLNDAHDFIAALHESTAGAAQIDKNPVLRAGERLKTTAAKLDKKCKAVLEKD